VRRDRHPSGEGEAVHLSDPEQLLDEKSGIVDAAWLPNGKSIVYSGGLPGHGLQTYLLDIMGDTPNAVTPEGTFGTAVSPDGKFLLALDAQRDAWLYPVAGGQPPKLDIAVKSSEIMVKFLDAKTILLGTSRVPLDVTRVDITTGRRKLWRQIVPADSAGVQAVAFLKFSADGKSYAYSALRMLSDLYVVENLK
jgi:hypothetical protein